MHAPSVSGCSSSNTQLRTLPQFEKPLRVTPGWTLDAVPNYQADGKSKVCSTHARTRTGRASAMPSSYKTGAASDPGWCGGPPRRTRLEIFVLTATTPLG